MGTSSSSRGSRSNSPLVPPWADLDGEGPGPAPEGDRFRGYRTALGQAVSKKDKKLVRTAIGRFARDASGGASVASRRMAPSAVAGGALVGLISAMGGGAGGSDIVGVDLSDCVGEEVQVAIQKIVEALTPDNGDGDKIRTALEAALSEVLEEQNTFDPTDLSEDDLVSLLNQYLVESVFLWMVYESDKAFQKSEDPSNAIDTEDELRELISVSVEEAINSRNLTSIDSLSPEQITSVEQDIIHDVFAVWEGYE